MTGVTDTTDGDAQVPAFWQALGLPGLIDVHTHFMPERVMAKVWAYFDSAGPLTGRPWPIAYRTGEEERLETLRGFGVRRFTALVYPHKPGMAAWLNTWAAAFAARTPDCLHTATFFPEPEAAGYVAEAVEAGARVFKAHVQVGAYDPGDPLLDPVWGLLSDAGIPVVTHCGHGPVPGAYTGPEGAAKVLARHPRLPMVVAHMGMPDYGAFLDLAEAYPHVHLDTTMAFTRFSEEGAPFPRDRMPQLAAAGERVLFGSDFPNIPYGYRDALRALEGLDLGDAWLRRVCWENAARLFGL